jgi:hypothetical protein
MKAYGGVVSFIPRERAPGTHWIRGWVGPIASLDDVEKRKYLTLPGLELRPLQPVASRYANCAKYCYILNYKHGD